MTTRYRNFLKVGFTIPAASFTHLVTQPLVVVLLAFTLLVSGQTTYSETQTVTNSSADKSSTDKSEQSVDTIVVLGDSLSAAYGIATQSGWVHLLDQHINQTDQQYTVINASISGETTDGGLRRLPGIIEQHEPDVLIIELGANDGLRGFPIKVMKNNLQAMIELAKENRVQVHLIGMHIPPNYGPIYTKQFYNVFQTLAETYDITVTPFLLDKVGIHSELMQQDGLHPTAEAQPIMLKNVLETLSQLL